MWNGKKKAVTFSFDDGILQDEKIIELLDKYGAKGTFNLNTNHLSQNFDFTYEGKFIPRRVIESGKVKERYKNHEIAVHTLDHINLTEQTDEEVIRQVKCDGEFLESLVGYEIYGMAYPCGGVNNDSRVAKLIKENTKIRYARTTTSSHNFDLQDDLLRFNPTAHLKEDTVLALTKEFVESKEDKPQILYLWGHSYELDMFDDYLEKLEKCLQMLSSADVYYGTNTEVLLNK